MDKDTALVEAVLYMETAPVPLDYICTASGLLSETVSLALSEIGAKCRAESSGIELLETPGGYMLSPKKDLWDILRAHYGKKNEQRLSKSALETLAIIAYKQPVTRAEIEQIRGVSADNMLRLLMERRLVRETGKKDAPGRPIQYGTTSEFLDFFRLSSIAELPSLDAEDSDRFELREE